jgi:hypothetical protein
MFGRVPHHRTELRSDLPPDELHAQLAQRVEVFPDFPLISKLSGGGVVIRVFKPPPTSLPFFGQRTPLGFRIAEVQIRGGLTPFQPIAEGRILEDGGGSRMELDLRPHPDARSFYATFGVVMLVAGGLLASRGDLGLGVTAALMATGFLLFPRFRAQHGFEIGVQSLLARLTEELDLRL